MIDYRKYILDNGLTVLTHEAWDTPLATVNVLYNVGSRDEDPARTGFAHLFEHLMFGGTERVPDFDAVVSGLGGESNAFTNTDLTNYYQTVPADALPTALMLEADRMASLSLNARALSVQQRVVTEEYNQRYMNQPYGDVWLLLRPLCYTAHPYRWATIGADIRHVGEATLADVQAFHSRYYRPSNAILAVAAPMAHEAIIAEVERAWAATCRAAGDAVEERCFARERHYADEPPQSAPRRIEVERDVPATALYMAWPMGDRFDARFRACDLLSDVLSNGHSSRLFDRLVREGRWVSEADAYISGEAGPGLMVMSARLLPGADVETVAEALRAEAREVALRGVTDAEMEKVKNKYESTFLFSHYKAADRALSLCHYTWLGDTALANSEPEAYRLTSTADVQRAAQEVFRPEAENMLVVKKREC